MGPACRAISALAAFLIAAGAAAQDRGRAPVAADGDLAAPTLRERTEAQNRWLRSRFDTVLPALMRREGIDLWLVICREHNEDPVYRTLVPGPSMFAWRLTMLAFSSGPGGVEAVSVNPWGRGDLHKAFAGFYRPGWDREDQDPWERLAALVRAKDPKRIAVDRSKDFAFADGLSAELEDRLRAALGPELSGRIVSAERLVVGWLETRTPDEIAVYARLVAMNHRLVEEAFSRRAVTPGITTVDDLGWWARERIAALGLDTWFPPMFSVARATAAGAPEDRVIRPGDLLHCDVGVTGWGLNSDIQENAYVLRPGETEAPAGLSALLAKGLRAQDILAGELVAGRTGNEILRRALAATAAAGLSARIYSHPLGVHGHAAGTRIGLPDMQAGVPGMGEYPLYPDTVHAIELSVRAPVPEWNGREVSMAVEEDLAFTARGGAFLDGRKTRLILIR